MATLYINRGGYNSPVRRRLVVLTAWFALALATTASAQIAGARSLVYGGDREFPPYEYLDDQGKPQGFNIQLMRALARDPERRDRIYAVVGDGYLFESGNRGQAWEPINTAPVGQVSFLFVVRI